jgi:hypothetical protein
MTDTEAIALYVAAGNPREDWAAIDDRDRWPWRKMALEMANTPGFEPGTYEVETRRSIRWAIIWLTNPNS